MIKKTLLCTAIAIGLSAQAQISIPASAYDLPITPDSAHSGVFVNSTNQVAVPSTGPNQQWDYTSIDASVSVSAKFAYKPYDQNPNFPNADCMESYNPSIGALAIVNSRAYYRMDADGLYYLGFEHQENAYSIGTISGNPDDTLYMLSSVNNHGSVAKQIEFPIQYEGSVDYSHTAETDMEITVTNFMMNKVPAMLKQIVEVQDTVVGWGEITIAANGYVDVPALLVMKTITALDSFFVNNQPADPTLLNAFGLVQGDVSTSSNYSFYVYDNVEAKFRPALMLNLNSGGTQVTDGSYDESTYKAMSIHENIALDAKLYPNPVTEGKVHFELAKPAASQLIMEVHSMTGQLMYTENLAAGSQAVEVRTQEFAQGFYFVKVTDPQNRVVFNQKFVVK